MTWRETPSYFEPLPKPTRSIVGDTVVEMVLRRDRSWDSSYRVRLSPALWQRVCHEEDVRTRGLSGWSSSPDWRGATIVGHPVCVDANMAPDLLVLEPDPAEKVKALIANLRRPHRYRRGVR